MAEQLTGKRIGFFATDGVEQVELVEPWTAAQMAGAFVELVAPKPGRIQGMNHDDKADTFPVDRLSSEVAVEDYDAIVIPGGVANPDRLRLDEATVEYVRAFSRTGKPIASICHGPWVLVEADIVDGLTLTSWPSLATDIENAGGTWVDREVVVDMGIVTSRKPADLPVFIDQVFEVIAEGRTAERPVAGVPR